MFHFAHRRQLAWWLVLGLMSSQCTGCGSPSSEPQQSKVESGNEGAFAGQSLELGVPAGFSFPQRWGVLLSEWKAQTGANVNVVEIDFNNPDALIKWRAAQSGTDKHATHVLLAPTSALPWLCVDDLLAEVPAAQQSAELLNWPDLFAGLRRNAAAIGQKARFLPVSMPVFVCYYRRDLLEKAGLQPPRTWDDYQKLIDTLDRWAPGLTVVEPWGPRDRGSLFLARAAALAKTPSNVSYTFDLATGKPLIATEGFVRALELSRAAVAKMPAGVANYSAADCRRDFLAGKAALGISIVVPGGSEDAQVAPPADAIASAAADSPQNTPQLRRAEGIALGICRLPASKAVFNASQGVWEQRPGEVNVAGVAGSDGWAMAVSSRCTPDEATAAWNLLGTIALGHLSDAFPGAMRGVCRISQQSNAAEWLTGELTPGEAQQAAAAIADTLDDAALAFDLPVIESERYRAALAEQLGRFLFTQQEPSPGAAQALSNVAGSWNEISKSLGEETVRKSHARMLGFDG